MTKIETRLPCPVCLGVTMQKTAIPEGVQLMLDHCTRCGGMWFEFGEIQQLRKCGARALWRRIPPPRGVHNMQCHGCHTLLERNERRCSACGWNNRLDCPSCHQSMEIALYYGVQLDVCQRCKGVWFDHHELADLWALRLNQSAAKRSSGVFVQERSAVLLDALTIDPWLTFYGADAAAHALGASAQVLAEAPGFLASAGDVIGEAAAAVFETIVEIVAGIFG